MGFWGKLFENIVDGEADKTQGCLIVTGVIRSLIKTIRQINVWGLSTEEVKMRSLSHTRKY